MIYCLSYSHSEWLDNVVLCITVREVRPTVFMGVPRVWEKIKDAVELQLTQMTGFKKWAFDRAAVSRTCIGYIAMFSQRL